MILYNRWPWESHDIFVLDSIYSSWSSLFPQSSVGWLRLVVDTVDTTLGYLGVSLVEILFVVGFPLLGRQPLMTAIQTKKGAFSTLSWVEDILFFPITLNLRNKKMTHQELLETTMRRPSVFPNKMIELRNSWITLWVGWICIRYTQTTHTTLRFFFWGDLCNDIWDCKNNRFGLGKTSPNLSQVEGDPGGNGIQLCFFVGMYFEKPLKNRDVS